MMGTKAIPIYIPAKRPRIGTIGKNHIQSSSNLSRTALFVVCSESDTFLKNYNMDAPGSPPVQFRENSRLRGRRSLGAKAVEILPSPNSFL